MKNYFKSKKVKLPKPQEPRPLAEIEREYGELRTRAADSQYLIYVHTKALSEYNDRMLRLNQEGGARKELDAKAQAEATKEAAGGE